MLKLSRMPAKVIAYVMESFGNKAHARGMVRLGPGHCFVGGNKYDYFPKSDEDAIVVVVAYGDAERNMLADRLRNSRSAQTKIQIKLAAARKAFTDAQQACGRLTGVRKDRAAGARDQFEIQVQAHEQEVERLKAIEADLNGQLLTWEAQKSFVYRYSEVEGTVFDLSEVEMIAGSTETALEEIIRRVGEGDAHAIAELRKVMPTEELSWDQVEGFVLEREKTPDKVKVSFLVQKIKEGRQVANTGSELPVVQSESDVAGGSDDKGLTGPDPVPALPGAAAPSSEPDQLQTNPVKPNRAKRS